MEVHVYLVGAVATHRALPSLAVLVEHRAGAAVLADAVVGVSARVVSERVAVVDVLARPAARVSRTVIAVPAGKACPVRLSGNVRAW